MEAVQPIIFISAMATLTIGLEIWGKKDPNLKNKTLIISLNIVQASMYFSALYFHCDYCTSTPFRVLFEAILGGVIANLRVKDR